MPYLRLPDGSYADVPKGMSYEEALDAAKRAYPKLFGIEPTVGGQVREFVKGIPAGVVGSLGQAARGIGALLPEEYETPFAESVTKTTKALTPQAAPGYDDTVGRKLGEAMGSVASFLIPGGAAGAGAKALGAGLSGIKAAEIAAAGSLGSAAGAGEARTRAEQEGATPEQRRTATQFGAAIGLSEIAPVERLLGTLGKETVGGLVGYVKRALVTGGIEAGQEAASNVAQNLVAQKIYKPSQELIEGVGESAAYGAGAGALTQVLLDLALGKRAGPKPADLEAQRKAQEAQRQEQQLRAEQQRAATQAPFAVGPQGRLFEGEASALPVRQSMQQLYAQIKEAEDAGDTQTASILRNDFNRLSAQLKDPEALQQQRDELQKKSEDITRQIGETAAVNPAAAQTLFQQNVAVKNQIKQVDALLAQTPPTLSPKQAQALQKQYNAAAEAGDEQKMLALGAKLAPYNAQVDTTGDLLAGVGFLPGEIPSQRAAREAAEETEAGYVAPMPPASTAPDTLFTQQQKLAEQADVAAARAAAKQKADFEAKLEKQEELRMRGMPKTGEAPTIYRYGEVPPDVISTEKQKKAEDDFFSALEKASGKTPLNASQLRLRQTQYNKYKENALFDLANTVDSLRKGDVEDKRVSVNILKNGFEEGMRLDAHDAKERALKGLFGEIGTVRQQQNTQPLTDEERRDIETTVNDRFDRLIETAAPNISQEPTAINEALKKAIAKKINEVKQRAQDPTKRAGVRQALAELEMLRKKQTAIPRGVSFSKEQAAKNRGAIPEYEDWQRFFNKIAFDYGFKTKKRKVVPGTSESFAKAFMRRPSEKTEIAAETIKRGEKEKTLPEELAKGRSYAIERINNLFANKKVASDEKNILTKIKERLENGGGTRTLIKETNEAVSRVAIGQAIDATALRDALQTEEIANQAENQLELFVKPAREERAPGEMLTSVKRSTPELFQKFVKSIHKRTDEAVYAFINKQNLPDNIVKLENEIKNLDKKVSTLFGARIDAAIQRLFAQARKAPKLQTYQKDLKTKWEKLYTSKKWKSVADIQNAKQNLAATDFTDKLDNLIKVVEANEANKIIKESKEWLEDKEVFQQFFDDSGFFNVKAWDDALKTEIRLRSVGPKGLATQQVNADFANNLAALEKKKEALADLKNRVNTLFKLSVWNSFGPHIGETKQTTSRLIDDIKTVAKSIEKNIELRTIAAKEGQRRAAQQLQQRIDSATTQIKEASTNIVTVTNEIVPVKNAPKGTELRKVFDEIKAKEERIIELGKALNIKPRKTGSQQTQKANVRKSYFRVDIPRELLKSQQQRFANNERLRLLEERAKLQEQLVMLVPTKRVQQKLPSDMGYAQTNTNVAEEIASRRLPRRHADITSNLEAVRKRLKSKKITKKTRETLQNKLSDLNNELLQVEESAKKFGINLAERVFDFEKTAKAQQKTMREMEAAERRENKKTSTILKFSKKGLSEEERQNLERQQRRSSTDLQTAAAQFGFYGRDAEAFAQAAKDDGLDETAFREATNADSGVAAKDAADVAARVAKALPKGVNFVYAPTIKDAPPAFLAALYRSGKTTAKGAVLPDGTVVVVGEAHKNTADLEETIAHELIGHYGVDTVLGPERMQALVDRLFKQGEAHVADVATALGVFPDVETALAAKDLMQNADIKMSIVREMIAHAAEGRRVAPTFTEKVKTFIRDMVAAVRGWFRSSGLSDMAKRDAKEIQAIIRQASQDLAAGQLGVYRTPSGEVAFRTKTDPKPEWMSQESYDLSNAIVDTKPGWFDNLKGNLLGLTGVTQFIDRSAPFIAALNRGVAQNKITDLEATQARYNLSMHDKLMNNTREIVENGPMQLNKYGEGDRKYWMAETAEGKDNPSLVKVFTALNKSGLAPDQAGRFFTLYLAGLRTKNEGIGVDKLNFGVDEQGNPILTEAKLQTFEKEILSQPKIKEAFQEAREIYNNYNKGLIDFAVQTGALSADVAAELKRKKDYIPFYRAKRDGSVDLVISGENPISVGNLKDQPYLHELVGGNKPILDIFTSSVQNTHMLTDMALRNLATKNTAHMLYKLGMLETKKNKKTGKETGIFIDTGTIQGPDILRFKDNGENKYVVVKTEGTMFSDISPELLVKGMEGIKTTFPKALELLSAPAKLLRRFVVLSPLYPVRQIVKDSLSVSVTGGANFMPIVTPFKNVANALAGRKSETFETMQRRGLVGGQVLAGEGMEGISTILRGVVGGKTNLTAALAWLESKSMLADTAVREAAYNSFKKQGLNDIEAWVATNELTDFNKRGLSPGMYVANAMIPFFNAQIQGLNVFAKAATGRMPFNERLKTRQKFYKRGMGLAALTLLYAAAMEDDEAYKNAKPDQKYNNWFIRTPLFDEPLKIPIPYEVGILFKAIPEAIYNTAFGKEEFEPVSKAIGKMLFNAIPGGSSYGMPQAAKPIVEMVTGVDLFTGADIESAREQALDPAARYRENTTELAKMLGSLGIPGLSPLKIDQFIRTVGSQTLLAAVSAADVVLGAEKPPSAEMKTSQLPVVGGLFQPSDAGGVIDRTYELMKEAEQTANTYNKLLTEKTPEEAEAYLQANLSRMMLSDSVAEFRNEMKDITDYELLIKRGDDTPAEKRKKLDEARQLKIEVARIYRDLAKQF